MLKIPALGTLTRMPPSVTIYFYISPFFQRRKIWSCTNTCDWNCWKINVRPWHFNYKQPWECLPKLCLLKLLNQNRNPFKDNLTNTAVVKEGAEEACPIWTTEMVTLGEILVNSKYVIQNEIGGVWYKAILCVGRFILVIVKAMVIAECIYCKLGNWKVHKRNSK